MVVEYAAFSVLDYVVFSVMLCISMGIGVFFAIRGNKNPEEFLMGGRSMSVLPVSISLLSTFISAISILGFSGETYAYGMQLVLLLIGAAIGIFMATVIFLPVFYPLKLISVMEYIEMRFQSNVLRLTVLIASTATGLLYTGLCLYAPTLALSSVTPISVDTYIILLGIICTVYCTIGGLKAVVWTDTFQMGVILLGVIAIIVVGCLEVGGIGNVWDIATRYNRTDLFDFNVNPYQRHNFWNIVTMGATVYFSFYGANQANLQRACSVPTMADAIKVYLLNLLGMVVTVSTVFFSGLCAFVNYAGCDPVSLGHIDSKDQILPYFVMDKLGSYGMPGLFVATLLSGALSSMSSVINSIVAMVWADLYERVPFFHNMSQNGAALTNKLLSTLIGAIMMGLAFMCKGFSGLFQAAFTIMGIMSGPTLGVFTMGLLFPHIGKKSAWCGIVSSMVIMTWIIIGANTYNPKPEMKPFSTEDCPISMNGTLNATTTMLSKEQFDRIEQLVNGSSQTADDFSVMTKTGSMRLDVEMTTSRISLENGETKEGDINDWPMMWIYGISYTLYTPLGVVLALIVAILSLPFTGLQDLSQVRPELIAPICRVFLPKKSKMSHDFKVAYSPVTTDFRDFKEFRQLKDLKDFNSLTIPPPHMKQQYNHP